MGEPDRRFSFWKKQMAPCDTERQTLLDGLARTRTLISQAYSGFNTTQDPDLIESYVFEINALQSRYCYLLRRVKELDACLPTAQV
ncbi:MAG: DUF2508 family protein [Oscillospiraceae bacterium]|nr:DUF2508 family protein [Oscillospiraceae bacterium]